MAPWFTFTGGCTQAQATELDALAKTLGMGDDAGLDLYAKTHACPVAKARHCMSIERTHQSIDWARERLNIARHRVGRGFTIC